MNKPASALALLLLLLDATRAQRGVYSNISKVGGLRDEAEAAGVFALDDYEYDDDAEVFGNPFDDDVSAASGGCGERIVIVGGGFAGLTAARDLLIAGHTDVTVLESRHEVGGRTATVEVDDGAGRFWPGITLGAHWILGSASGPDDRVPLGARSAAHVLATLAGIPDDEYQASWYPYGWQAVPLNRWPHQVANISMAGQLLTPEVAIMEKYWNQCQRNWVGLDANAPAPILNKAAKTASPTCAPATGKAKKAKAKKAKGCTQPGKQAKAAKGKPISGNWKEAFDFVAREGGGFSELAQKLLVTSSQEQDWGGPVSVNDMWAGGCWEGVEYTSDHNLRRGWLPIYTWLKEDIESRGGTVLLNTRVLEVLTDGTEVRVEAEDAVTGAPAVFVADRVVMTVSLAVMKEAAKDRLIKFTPSLPTPYLRALDALSMGQLEKFIIFFPDMFWTRTKYYRDAGKEGLYWLGQVPASLPPGVMKQAGILFNIENSSVVFWFSGDDAIAYLRHVQRGTPEFEAVRANVTAQAVAALTDIFENDERFLDVNDNVIPIPQPYEDLTVLTNWISDPNFLGCYAYLNRNAASRVTQYRREVKKIPLSHLEFDTSRAGSFEGFSKDRLTLALPASQGKWSDRLFFAGEHTSLSAAALVHGAVESGKRAAIEVNDQTRCNALTSRVMQVAVPYFRSRAQDRTAATYQRYSEILREPEWATYERGYAALGFPGKDGYERAGCIPLEWNVTFSEAEATVPGFRAALDDLNYIQDDDYDYAAGVGWVGDYNCYIHHYSSWSWADFEYYWGSTETLETLGYDRWQWEYGNSTFNNDTTKGYNQWWKDLNAEEQQAANDLCYWRYNWDFWGLFCE